MYIIPNVIKEKLHNDEATINIRIHFPKHERTDITNDMIVSGSAKFTESLCSQNELKFGLCESPVFECETVGVGNIKDAAFDLIYEVICESSVAGSVWKTDIQQFVFEIPMGHFVVKSCERQADLQHRKIVAYGGISGNEYKMPDIEIFKQSLVLGADANYNADLVKLALSLCDRVPVKDEELPLDESTITHMIDSVHDIRFVFKLKYIEQIHEIDNVLEVGGDWLYSYDEIITRCKDALYKFVAERGITYSDIYAKRRSENLFAIYDRGTLGNLYVNEDIYIRVRNRFDCTGLDEDSFWSRAMLGTTFTSRLIYPYINYGTTEQPNSRILIPYSVSLMYGDEKIYSLDFQENISLKEMDMELPEYRVSLPRAHQRIIVMGQTKDLYTLADAKDIINADYQKILEGSIEILAKLGKVNRKGIFELTDISKQFYLLPNEDLKPDADLKPLGVNGGSITKSMYSDCWYDERHILPFGRVHCQYKNENNKDAEMNIYLNGFNSSSDPTLYATYSITSNEVIKHSLFTSEQMEIILNNIATALIGVSYVPVQLKSVALPYVEAGDTLEVLTENNDSITTIVLRRTTSGESYITDEITSK